MRWLRLSRFKFKTEDAMMTFKVPVRRPTDTRHDAFTNDAQLDF